eukprot:TRINITY_DN44850_c0_g2_i1.p1 TRINITY_DN44850_c0_g2~~TRINITY_DN44850_c0_g2_i1.p1  ORF type:complete len:123 (-),score=29.24 TRINITY_DN44850_c0_g2_i1:595-963(-)
MSASMFASEAPSSPLSASPACPKSGRQSQDAAVMSTIGGIYSTPGDDPSQVSGERERPAAVLPMWAFDQFIETPAGAEPPSLTDLAFPSMGSRRYKRVAEYKREMEALQKRFTSGPTYTFSC